MVCGRSLFRLDQVSELVLTFFDDLVVVDPDVALAGKHVDVRLGFPLRVSLAAIGSPNAMCTPGNFSS